MSKWLKLKSENLPKNSERNFSATHWTLHWCTLFFETLKWIRRVRENWRGNDIATFEQQQKIIITTEKV